MNTSIQRVSLAVHGTTLAQGGAIHAHGVALLTLDHVSIRRVRVDAYGNGMLQGGGVFAYGSVEIRFSHVDVDDVAMNVHMAQIGEFGEGSTAAAGGGVFLSTDSNCSLNRVSIVNVHMIVDGDGPAGGGGLLLQDTTAHVAHLVIDNTSVITHGTGSAGLVIGGGVCVAGTAAVTLRDMRIARAHAIARGPSEAQGGAAYFGGALSITISDSSITEGVTVAESVDGSASAAEGGGVWVGFTSAVVMSRTLVSHSFTSGRGGGLFVQSGSVIMTNSTSLRQNEAALGGASYDAAGGETLYQLPAPAATWIAGVQCRVFREACERQPGSTLCIDPRCCDVEERCAFELNASAVVDGVHCQPVRFIQPCDWQAAPHLIASSIQVLPHSAIAEEFPFACGAGLLGSALPQLQAGPDCAGPCAVGVIDHVATRLDGPTDLCLPCPDGMWCNTGLANPCPLGTWAFGPADERRTLDACQRCEQVAAHSTTLSTGTPSAAGCVCQAGFLTRATRDSAKLQCDSCPAHLRCLEPNTTLVDLIVNPDYWRPSFRTTTARRCRHSRVCVGGIVPSAEYERSSMTAAATCAISRGVTGPFCELCLRPETHVFDSSTQRCRSCSETAGGGIALVAALAVLVLLAVAKRRRLEVLATSLAHRVSVNLPRISFRARLRMVVSFAQIVSQIEDVYFLRFPDSYRALVHVLRLSNVDLRISWIPALSLHCLGATSLLSRLLLHALLPVGVALLVLLGMRLRGRPAATALPLLFEGIFLLLPAISSAAFRALAPCECFTDVDGHDLCFLRDDFEIVCTGTLFGRKSAPPGVLAAACMSILLWAVGMPCAHIGFLSRAARQRVAANVAAPALQPVRAALSALSSDFLLSVPWWEVVLMLQKLLLVGFLALVHPGSRSQIFLATLIALFCFVLQVLVAPYRKPSDNLFAVLTSCALVAIFLCAFGLQAERRWDPQDTSAGNTALEVAALFGFTLMVLAAAVMLFVKEVHDVRTLLLLRTTGMPPVLSLAPEYRFHLFLSVRWPPTCQAASPVCMCVAYASGLPLSACRHLRSCAHLLAA